MKVQVYTNGQLGRYGIQRESGFLCVDDEKSRAYVVASNNTCTCLPAEYAEMLAALAQMVACLPLVQQVRGSIHGGVVNFHLKIFNFRARRGGVVHFLIARLYITVLD